nr:Maf family protein [Vibrio sp. VB16]
MKMDLYLASGSPRRKELLQQAGYRFSIVKPDVVECKGVDESPSDYVLRLAYEKSVKGFAMANSNATVLGSDTVVVLQDKVLEKPVDFQDSRRMLQALSGQRHQVLTAISIINKDKFLSKLVTTDVWFKPLNEDEISQYWQSGEPCDKAGSYGIQGLGGRFVSRIEGSYYAVVGLPLFETDQLLQEFL